MLSPATLADVIRSLESLEYEREQLRSRLRSLEKTIEGLKELRNGAVHHSNVSQFASEPSAYKIVSTSVVDAVREYLVRNQAPATSKEIYDGLRLGGFKFPDAWSPEYCLRNLAITLGKNGGSVKKMAKDTYWLTDVPATGFEELEFINSADYLSKSYRGYGVVTQIEPGIPANSDLKYGHTAFDADNLNTFGLVSSKLKSRDRSWNLGPSVGHYDQAVKVGVMSSTLPGSHLEVGISSDRNGDNPVFGTNLIPEIVDKQKSTHTRKDVFLGGIMGSKLK